MAMTMKPPVYEARNGVVWKRSVQRMDDATRTVRITMGFPVCTPSDYVGAEGAETIAALLNAGEAHLSPETDAKVEATSPSSTPGTS